MEHVLTINYSDMLLASSGISVEEFSRYAHLAVAAKLFLDAKLTAGQAAKFYGCGKVEFLNELFKHGCPMSNLSTEDLNDDIAFANHKP